MFCMNCGASNKDDAEFCVNCGESFSEVKAKGKRSPIRILNEVSFLNKIDFLKGLCDFSLDRFISPQIMKFLYGLSILSAGLSAFLLVFVGFNISTWVGIFSLLIGAPLVFFLIVIYSRVFLEIVFVVSRMADQVANINMTDKEVIDKEDESESKDGIRWNI